MCSMRLSQNVWKKIIYHPTKKCGKHHQPLLACFKSLVPNPEYPFINQLTRSLAENEVGHMPASSWYARHVDHENQMHCNDVLLRLFLLYIIIFLLINSAFVLYFV